MLSKREDVSVSKETVRFIWPASVLLAVIFALGLVLGACSQSETNEADTGKKKTIASSSEPKLHEASRVNCSTFTADDAAAILSVPASEIQADSQELYAGSWLCGYKGANLEKMISFNISISKSVQEAVTDMEQYRGHLEIAKGTEPFKDDLAKGAYSDISGVGDDALWTAANGTLTVRKDNVSLQVQLPKEKDAQIKVAEKFLARLSD